MNIQVFGTKKSFDTKKAQRYFKERRVKFQFIDLKEKGMSKGELESVARAVGGIDVLVDPKAKDAGVAARVPVARSEVRQAAGEPARAGRARGAQRQAGHGRLRSRRVEDVGVIGHASSRIRMSPSERFADGARRSVSSRHSSPLGRDSIE
mgnify:CR=1 FL=1